MININLLPLERSLRKQTQRTRAAWLKGLSIVAGVCLCVAACLTWVRVSQQYRSEDNGEVLEQRITQLEIKRSNLQNAQRELISHQNAKRFVTDRPNWGNLFALLDQTVGQNVVISHVQLEPTVIQDGVPSAYQIPIRGLAKTQADVSSMAIAMEDTQVFSRVQISKIQQEAAKEHKHVSFAMTAYLGDTQAGGY